LRARHGGVLGLRHVSAALALTDSRPDAILYT
jgi:hypothetical protein